MELKVLHCEHGYIVILLKVLQFYKWYRVTVALLPPPHSLKIAGYFYSASQYVDGAQGQVLESKIAAFHLKYSRLIAGMQINRVLAPRPKGGVFREAGDMTRRD